MRKSLGILLPLLIVSAFTLEAAAERAQRGRGKQKSAQKSTKAPNSTAIESAMEDVDWGWSHRKLITHFTRSLQKLYRPSLAKAPDAISEDRLRRAMNARIARIKGSYVEFSGQHTGWDTSLIRDEYTHNNNEALVEVRELRAGRADPRYTDYFFFINDHLWRRYRAFNQDQFEGIPFQTAAASFQKRFGPAREIIKNKQLVGLEWQDGNTRLEAVDNTEFFGVFCLVFSEKSTEARLDTLRTNKRAKGSGLNPLVEALDDTSTRDVHTDVVEHITGKRYNTAKQQKGVKGSGSSKQRGKSRPAKSKSSSSTIFDEPTRSKGSTSGDPLDDLEI